MDSPPRLPETMDFIVHFLRSEGFYAAEEALLREIENRYYPDGSSPSASAANTPTFAGQGEGSQSQDDCGETQDVESAGPARPASYHRPAQPREEEQVWHDEAQGSGASHSESLPGPSSYYEHLEEAPGDQQAGPIEAGLVDCEKEGTAEIDEYVDNNDPGYVREHIRGQDAFLAREVDISDEDASQRGLRLYHEAQGMKDLHWDRGRHEDREDNASSDGNGSSYFSGEVIERGNSIVSSQALPSDQEKPIGNASSFGGERIVTLMEPVNPKPLQPTSNVCAASSVAGSQQPSTSSDTRPAATSSSGPLSHPLSHVSSDLSAEGPLYHEPSLGASARDSKTTDTATSQASNADAADGGEQRPEGGWARGYLDPFGVIGRVFGRRSGSVASNASASKQDAGNKEIDTAPETEEKDPSLHQKLAEPEASGASAEGPGQQSSLVEDEVRRPDLAEVAAELCQDMQASTRKAPSEEERLQDEEPPCGKQLGAESGLPATPKLQSKASDSDLAFSFPVTPPSEPPAAAEPGSVFGTWPSLRNSSRKAGSKGDLTSRASSEYAASGYSTDEGGAHPPLWNLESRTDPLAGEVQIEAQAHSNLPWDGSLEGQSAVETTSGSETPPPSKPVIKAPVAIQPLDMQTSLPSKTTYDFSLEPRAGASTSPSEEALPAYKPPPQGAAAEQPLDFSHRSGELTERTMETALGGEDSTANGGAASADDYSSVTYRWDEDFLNEKYEVLTLKIIHCRQRTGFEESKDIAIHVNDLIAGRYQVTDFLGSAAFSQAVQALDIKTGALVCLKIIKNNKDYFDQSLDEIKLLKYVNEHDLHDEHGLLQLYDYFYYKEHLFLVCELLRANLYEFQKFNREHGQEPYFTLARVQSIARQVLRSLEFMHSLNLIHCDLKPENILIKSYSRCEVKVIDLGSSCFTTDHLSSYVQSRSYRAPEVILGLPYHQHVDIWSLGCILAELLSGYVLFQNDSLATLLARLEGILGPVPRWMLRNGRYAHRFYTRNGALYEQSVRSGRYELLKPKRTSLRHRVPEADEGCLDFLRLLLSVDPKERPSASEALQHPWLHYTYPEA